jgi:DNA-binding NtrC family response regulator
MVTSSIIVVDEDLDTAIRLAATLRRPGVDVVTALSAKACLERLETHVVDVVLTAVQMPVMSGLELCAELRRRHPETLTLVVSDHGNVALAIGAIRAGAYDFLFEPVKPDAIALAVARALQHCALRREVIRIRTVAQQPPASHIIGTSAAIKHVREMIARVADTDATILITGESGTGKEQVATALHHGSARQAAPFIAVNCAAVPGPLLESELFGHVRGAFTDARQTRPGLFAQAGRGTIFLDEISEMPNEMQVKLLRALQERRVRAVGSDEELPFQARVVAASNRDLEHEITERRFREDLYYRLNVVAITVPPLRERSGDVLQLAQHFLTRCATRNRKPVRGISPHAARLLMAYDWPGNVRELANCIERAVALCRLEEVTVEDLPAKLHEKRRPHLPLSTSSADELITIEEMERRYVRHVINAVGGNKSRAAKVLGMDRRSLYRRLEADAGE